MLPLWGRLTWQVWPQSSFEQDNPGWHSRPVCWGICTWRTEGFRVSQRSTATGSLIFFACVLHYEKNRWGSNVSKHESLGESKIWVLACAFTHSLMRSSLNIKASLKLYLASVNHMPCWQRYASSIYTLRKKKRLTQRNSGYLTGLFIENLHYMMFIKEVQKVVKEP